MREPPVGEGSKSGDGPALEKLSDARRKIDQIYLFDPEFRFHISSICSWKGLHCSRHDSGEGIMRMIDPWVCVLLCAVLAAAHIGCSEDEEQLAGGPATYSVSGTVTRSYEPDPELGDGRGDIHLNLMAECPARTGCLPEFIGGIVITDADLSEEGAAVPFEISGIPDGTYHLGGFMDDAVNTVNPENISETGDLVYFGQASPACVEVTVSGGDLQDVNLDLNWVMPFALPIDDEEVCSEQEEEEEDPDIEDDGDAYKVTVPVRRTTPLLPWTGGDGIGPLSVSLCVVCFDITGNVDDIVVKEKNVGVVDMSAPGSEVIVEFEDMPNGVYYVNGFIDDVTNATEENPFPGLGDLVSFGTIAPQCVRVVVDGGDVTSDPYTLNMVMIFDLPGF